MITLLEWVGSLFGVLGALTVASNTRFSPWGWWLFLVSSSALCAYSILAQAWGLLLLNSCFVGTNLLGLLRWWWPSLSLPCKKGSAQNSEKIVR